MADKFEDPTDPSDPSVTPEPDVDRAEQPSGDELMSSGDRSGSSHPDVTEGGELAPIEEEQLDEIVGEDFSKPTDAHREPGVAAAGSTALGAKRPIRRSIPPAAEVAAPRRRKNSSAKQPREDNENPRTSPPEFVRQSVGELRKVVWPTGEQVRGYFVVVLVFVLFIIAYVSVLDVAFGALLLQLFGS